MIDFNHWSELKLEDVAEYGRAKKGHVYPAGTTTIQISATRGQVGYLDRPGEIATKDVAIIPMAGINPKYFNFIIEDGMARFMNKYATGINIQEEEIGKFVIRLHDKDTQDGVVKMMNFVSGEEQQVIDEIAALKKMKAMMMANMFC